MAKFHYTVRTMCILLTNVTVDDCTNLQWKSFRYGYKSGQNICTVGIQILGFVLTFYTSNKLG